MNSEEENNSRRDDLEDYFEDIEIGELQNTRAPFLLEYPCGKKSFVVFPLDGDIFNTNILSLSRTKQKSSRVPKVRESAKALVGMGREERNSFGFSDIHLFLIDAEIERRLKSVQSKQDSNEYIYLQWYNYSKK